MHQLVKGHAGVSWGQPEGNCLEMRKAIKCSQNATEHYAAAGALVIQTTRTNRGLFLTSNQLISFELPVLLEQNASLISVGDTIDAWNNNNIVHR